MPGKIKGLYRLPVSGFWYEHQGCGARACERTHQPFVGSSHLSHRMLLFSFSTRLARTLDSSAGFGQTRSARKHSCRSDMRIERSSAPWLHSISVRSEQAWISQHLHPVVVGLYVPCLRVSTIDKRTCCTLRNSPSSARIICLRQRRHYRQICTYCSRM